MHAQTALLTAAALVVAYLPAVTVIAAEPLPTASIPSSTAPEVVDRNAYVDEDGREIEVALWFEDGQVSGDVAIFDPAGQDSLFMWIEGDTFVFEGVSGGEAFRGSEPISTFFDTPPDSPICVGWVALVCLGAAAILSSNAGCALFEGCIPTPEPEVPGGQGGAGEGEGEGEGGGGGDGEDE